MAKSPKSGKRSPGHTKVSGGGSKSFRLVEDGFFTLDNKGIIITLNTVAEKTIFQRPSKELLGRNIFEEHPNLIGSEFQNNYHNVLQAKRPVHFEAHSIESGRWFDVHACPKDALCEFYITDITDRRKAEAAQDNELMYRASSTIPVSLFDCLNPY